MYVITNKFHSAVLFYIFKRDLLSLNHFYSMLMMNLNPKNKTGLGEQVSIGVGKTCTKELVQIPIGMSILVYVRVSVEFYLLERKKLKSKYLIT